MAVEHMKTCESVDKLANELGVTRRCLYKWRTKLEAVECGEEAARPALGYRPPEEFEQQSERGHSADSLGATVQFSVNDENAERASTGGRGLKRRPLPQTPTLARRCKNVEMKSGTVSKVFVTV
jgi:transposase-like protein